MVPLEARFDPVMDIAVHPDAAALAAWDGPIDDTIAFTGRVARHPRFPEASRTLAGNMLALAAADRALDGVFKDAGRYIAAMLAVYLDTTGGVTLPSLKDICAQSGFLSPGRARALLAYMLYLGYLELMPVSRRGVPGRYLLTSRFVESWRLYLASSLEAAQVIEPGVGVVSRALARAEVVDTYIRLQGETLFEASREAQRRSAFVEVFLNRHAGTQFIHTLVTATPPGASPTGSVPGFSLAGTARRLGVSRIHLRRMLDDGERRGLLTLGPQGEIQFLDLGLDEIAFLYSLQIGRMLTCAARTLKAHPQIADQP